MGYPQLIEALRAETQRSVAEIVQRAEREADEIVRKARDEASLDRRRRILEAEEANTALRSRLVAAAELAASGDVLVEKRALLERVRVAAETAVKTHSDDGLLTRLYGLLGEIREERVELLVTPGREDLVRDLLRKSRPQLIANVSALQGGRVGVEVRTDAEVLDDTLASRIGRLWRLREAEIAALLFEGADDAL